MDMTSLVISMCSMGGLGALFAGGLILANIKLQVNEDPRIILVLEELPGANCGGCGLPGCAAFAESIVSGKAAITGCPVNTQEGVDQIANIMGLEAVAQEREYARILCQGGQAETAPKGEYLGIHTCLAAHLTFGGDKLCRYGCLGYGDCVKSCQFDAIAINANGLPVVSEDKCTGCGNCTEACPRGIIEVHPEQHNIFIFCKNQDDAKYSRTVCTKACNACKACIKGVEEGQINLKNNLAEIDYQQYGVANELPTSKCPTGAIGLLQNYPLNIPRKKA